MWTLELYVRAATPGQGSAPAKSCVADSPVTPMAYSCPAVIAACGKNVWTSLPFTLFVSACDQIALEVRSRPLNS